MKIFRVLFAIIVVVTCIRATNLAGPISFVPVLERISSLSFDVQPLKDLLAYFADSALSEFANEWSFSWNWEEDMFNNVGRLFEFLGAFLQAYVDFCVDLFKIVKDGLWSFMKDLFSLLADLFDIILYVLGFSSTV